MSLKKYRLLKYPGAKWGSLSDIYTVWKSSGCHTFVDVFGGSGNVSLNVEADKIIYNEVNEDLRNLFLTIKNRYKEFYAFAQQNGVSASALKKVRNMEGETDVERAFSTLVKYNAGFGGMGDTYEAKNNGDGLTVIRRILQQMPLWQDRLKAWDITGKDFRAIFETMDGEDTFFYLDPPYFGKSWYVNNFKRSDYRDLQSYLKSLKGKYLLNMDTESKEAKSIFGNPQYIKKYPNRNGGGNEGRPEFRYLSFYTNVV